MMQWLASLPEAARRTAEMYPPGTKFLMHGAVNHVISYEDDGRLSVSMIDPAVNYEKSVATRQTVCNCCMEKLGELRIA